MKDIDICVMFVRSKKACDRETNDVSLLHGAQICICYRKFAYARGLTGRMPICTGVGTMVEVDACVADLWAEAGRGAEFGATAVEGAAACASRGAEADRKALDGRWACVGTNAPGCSDTRAAETEEEAEATLGFAMAAAGCCSGAAAACDVRAGAAAEGAGAEGPEDEGVGTGDGCAE